MLYLRRARTLLVPAIVLALVSCTDSNLTTVAKGLSDVATSISAVQTTAINANAQGLLSQDDTARILVLTNQVSVARDQASKITRGLTKLDPTNQSTVGAVIVPVVAAVQSMLATGVISIPNATVRNSIQAGLTTLLTALAAIQAVTAGSGPAPPPATAPPPAAAPAPAPGKL